MSVLSSTRPHRGLHFDDEETLHLSDGGSEDEATTARIMQYSRQKRGGHDPNELPESKKPRNGSYAYHPLEVKSSRNEANSTTIPSNSRVTRSERVLRPRRLFISCGNSPATNTGGLVNVGKQLFTWVLKAFENPADNNTMISIEEEKSENIDQSGCLTEDESDNEMNGSSEMGSPERRSRRFLLGITNDIVSPSPVETPKNGKPSAEGRYSSNSDDEFLTPPGSPMAKSFSGVMPRRSILSPQRLTLPRVSKGRVSINRTPQVREIANRFEASADDATIWNHRDLDPEECEIFKNRSMNNSSDSDVTMTMEERPVPAPLPCATPLIVAAPPKSDNQLTSSADVSSSSMLSPRTEAAMILVEMASGRDARPSLVIPSLPAKAPTGPISLGQPVQQTVFPAPRFLPRVVSALKMAKEPASVSVGTTAPFRPPRSKMFSAPFVPPEKANRGPHKREINLPRFFPRSVAGEIDDTMGIPPALKWTYPKLRYTVSEMLSTGTDPLRWLPPDKSSEDLNAFVPNLQTGSPKESSINVSQADPSRYVSSANGLDGDVEFAAMEVDLPENSVLVEEAIPPPGASEARLQHRSPEIDKPRRSMSASASAAGKPGIQSPDSFATVSEKLLGPKIVFCSTPQASRDPVGIRRAEERLPELGSVRVTSPATVGIRSEKERSLAKPKTVKRVSVDEILKKHMTRYQERMMKREQEMAAKKLAMSSQASAVLDSATLSTPPRL